jgi:hypothetical protein
MSKNLKLAFSIGGAVVVLGLGMYFLNQDKSQGNPSDNAGTGVVQKSVSGDFIRMGEKSFGLDVCNEMTKEEVGAVFGKTVEKTRDYSNGMSSGCEYYVEGQHFVIVDVGFDDMETQRKGLEFLERTIKSDDRIGLPNMLVYSERGLIDIYMLVQEGKKFVRVGRSSTTVVTEEELIKLAIAVEQKIRSYK